jgi:hypothetical protein
MRAYKGSRGTALLVLNFDTRLNSDSVVSFTLQLLYTKVNNPRYALSRRLVGTRMRSGPFAEVKYFLSIPGIEPPIF